MNELETNTPAALEAADLPSQTAALQRQLTTLLLAVVVLTGTVGLYLYQQQRYLIQDRDGNTQTAAQMLQVYQQQKPLFDSFTSKLQEFGRTHQDFVPVLTRYGLTSAPPAVIAPKAPTATPKATPKK